MTACLHLHKNTVVCEEESTTTVRIKATVNKKLFSHTAVTLSSNRVRGKSGALWEGIPLTGAGKVKERDFHYISWISKRVCKKQCDMVQ